MARLGRYFLAEQPLHVIQRGNNREAVFYCDEDYERYREWLAAAAAMTGMTSCCGPSNRSMARCHDDGCDLHSDRQDRNHCPAALPVAASTRIVPVMWGWSEQKYSYVPGVLNVNENLSSVSSALLLNSLVLEATVCGMSSSLIQVTVVPAFTVTRCGAKVKLSIFTS
jgi:hypothetical protein